MSRILLLIGAIAVSCLLIAVDDPVSGGLLTDQFVVDSTGDGGDLALNGTCDANPLPLIETCTLRAAIEEANASQLFVSINFDIPGDGPHTITPATPYPTITKTTTIDGYSEPGATANTLGVGGGSDAQLMIVLDLVNLPDNAAGLHFDADGSVVRGLGILELNNAGRTNGVRITANNNRVEGNIIGMHPSTDTVGFLLNGVLILDGEGNTVGGTDPEDRNLMAVVNSNNTGDGNSVYIVNGANNLVIGNLLGTDRTGTQGRSDGNGVRVSGDAFQTTVGGHLPEERNVISGGAYGILVTDAANEETRIYGNFIGTQVDGVTPLSNSAGIWILGASLTRIGESGPIDGVCDNGCNVISGNSFGIDVSSDATGSVVTGNHIGTGVNNDPSPNSEGGVVFRLNAANNSLFGNVIAHNDGAGVVMWSSAGTGNWLLGNSIHDNAGLGVDLIVSGNIPDGPNGNDALDADSGANNLQNAPVLTSAVAGSTRVTGAIQAEPNADLDLQWFYSDECDPSGRGEGTTVFGYTDLAPDADGTIEIDETLSNSAPVGSFVTALAHSLAPGASQSSTSEFSNCVEVQPGPTPTPSPTGPTPTSSASATPGISGTPTPTAGPNERIWGDLLCDGSIGTEDIIAGLAFLAEVAGPEQAAGCPAIGDTFLAIPAGASLLNWGDTDCDGTVEARDDLSVLLVVADLPQLPREIDCPDVGGAIAVVPT